MKKANRPSKYHSIMKTLGTQGPQPRKMVGTIIPQQPNSQVLNSGDSDIDGRVFVKFGGRAGEALPVDSQHVGYVEYSHALGTGDDSVSEWAPFRSRTEWELARWAKLRGPSSTALSELLEIDGVS